MADSLDAELAQLGPGSYNPTMEAMPPTDERQRIRGRLFSIMDGDNPGAAVRAAEVLLKMDEPDAGEKAKVDRLWDSLKSGSLEINVDVGT